MVTSPGEGERTEGKRSGDPTEQARLGVAPRRAQPGRWLEGPIACALSSSAPLCRTFILGCCGDEQPGVPFGRMPCRVLRQALLRKLGDLPGTIAAGLSNPPGSTGRSELAPVTVLFPVTHPTSTCAPVLQGPVTPSHNGYHSGASRGAPSPFCPKDPFFFPAAKACFQVHLLLEALRDCPHSCLSWQLPHFTWCCLVHLPSYLPASCFSSGTLSVSLSPLAPSRNEISAVCPNWIP